MAIVARRHSLWLAVIGLAFVLRLVGNTLGLAIVQPHFLPAPEAVAAEIVKLCHVPFAGALLSGHILASLQKFAIGFALAVIIGIPLGLIMGLSRVTDRVVTPLFDAVRFVPPIAWVPFSVLWFGTSPIAPMLIVFAGAFAPCVINSYRGAKFRRQNAHRGCQKRLALRRIRS